MDRWRRLGARFGLARSRGRVNLVATSATLTITSGAAKLKGFAAEATFYAGLRQAERAADASTGVEPIEIWAEASKTSPSQTVNARVEVDREAEQPTSKTEVADIAKSIRGTARKTPPLAVASAASWINQELREALGIENLYEKLSTSQLVQELRSKGQISQKTANQIFGLVIARNALERLRFEPLSVEGAIRFVDVTEQVVTAIREGQ